MYVTKLCDAMFYHLHHVRRIKKYLSHNSILTLIRAFITSCLDYCKGLPKSHIIKLQYG